MKIAEIKSRIEEMSEFLKGSASPDVDPDWWQLYREGVVCLKRAARYLEVPDDVFNLEQAKAEIERAVIFLWRELTISYHLQYFCSVIQSEIDALLEEK